MTHLLIRRQTARVAAGLVVLFISNSLTLPTSQAEETAPPATETRAVASRGTPPRVTSAGSGTISMDLVDASLEDVLKLLSQQAGLNFVAAQAVRDKHLTVYMDRVPVQTAIQSVLDANTLAFRRIENSDVFIVTESGGRLIKLTTKVYTLKYAHVLPTAGEAVDSFGKTGSLITTTFTGAGGSAGGAASGGTAATTKDQGIVAILKQLLTERGLLAIDPRTNSISITDVPEIFPAVEATLAKLDIKPAQLLIEAEILEVTLDTLRRLGIEYGGATGDLATFTGPKKQTVFPLGPRLLNYTTEPTKTLSTLDLSNFSMVLKALATEKNVKFLASPRLTTLSNEVAEIRIVTDASTGLTSTSQSQTGTVTQVLERQTVGTVLRVTPLVTEDQHITMIIEPEVSRVIESSKFSSFLDPNRRAARTTVMVQDGGTAMIAGLISREREESVRKVPLLGDIPFLGIPFRRTLHSDTETEIVIFITPHILRDTPAPSTLARTIPLREQTPISTQEQIAYRRYRDELLQQRRLNNTADWLTKP